MGRIRRTEAATSGSFPLPGRESHPLEAPGLSWRTEKAVDVGLHHISIPPVLQVNGQVTDRIPCPACRPVPITTSQQLLLIDRIQDSGTGGLEEFILYDRYSKRPLLAVALRNVPTTYQLRPVPLLLQPLSQCLDIRLQMFCIRVPGHAVHPTGRVLIQVTPGVQQKFSVQAMVSAQAQRRAVAAIETRERTLAAGGRPCARCGAPVHHARPVCTRCIEAAKTKAREQAFA